MEKIRQESGAQVRVLSRDQVPPCASPGDELIQVVVLPSVLLGRLIFIVIVFLA